MKTVTGLFKGLPLQVAARIVALHAAKRFLGLPIRFSYSQTGEDLILSTYLPEATGFYVDVGANRPLRYSNTFFLYRRGWRGITVDANAALVAEHRRTRRRDVCVNAALSSSETDVVFHRSTDHLVSTIDAAQLERAASAFEFRSEDREIVRTRTLTAILDEHVPSSVATIDLLAIDVEGHEFEVLSGLDFARYRPRVVVIEVLDLTTIESNRSHRLLLAQGYALLGYATMNAYYRRA